MDEATKVKMALKYKLLSNYTSLFGEVELSDKISENIKLEIIGNKEDNIIKKLKKPEECYAPNTAPIKEKLPFYLPILDFFKSIGNSIKSFFKIEEEEVIEDEFMTIIHAQDYIEGFWDVNKKTNDIKKRYQKEFNNLKQINGKNIDDKVAMTVIIIYCIYKEHSELLNELIMIIKKGKLFIQKKTGDNYDNLLKEIGIN